MAQLETRIAEILECCATMMLEIVHSPKAVIACVQGTATAAGCQLVSACDLAIACDMRIAADDIQMGMVPARLGMVYFPDGIQRFIRTIGWPNTKEMFFTGRRYKAGQLKAMGLADNIVNMAFGFIIGGVAAAAALAFGLGGRDAAKTIADHWANKISNK